MVSELHRLGYQGLRVMPFMNPLGFRLAIAPKFHFSACGGVIISEINLMGPSVAITAAGNYFGWVDAENDDARALAVKFIDRFPNIANQGKERDWEYAGWLAELVGFLEQGDWVPTIWWENMKCKPEELQALPIWVADKESLRWDEQASIMSPRNPTFPLPPICCTDTKKHNLKPDTIWWGEQRYWIDALNSISTAMEDGGRIINIDMKKIDEHLFDGDGPAYRLLDAMQSVIEHEGWDGFKGAPRLVKALLWKLQELSE